MAAEVSFWLRREYLGFQRRFENDVCANHFVEKFSSSQQDLYKIEGAMGMPLPPFMAKFSQDLLNGHMLSVADEDGHVTLLDTTKSKEQSLIKEWAAHSNAVFDLAWISNEAKLVTASGDQTARLWDVEKAETLAILKGHTCSLKSVSVQPRCNNIFLTGARDGKIMLWDTRCSTRNGYSNPVNVIRNAHVLPQKESLTPSGKKRRTRRSTANSDSKQSVTSVVYQDNFTIISSGACDGVIKYWDTRKTYTNQKSDPVAFHMIPFPGKGHRKYGYSSLALNSTCSRLYAVCTNDIIYEYATGNLSKQPIATYHGHLASSFYVKATLSPDDRFLLCGSGDNNAYIWSVKDPEASPWLLKGHFGEVTSVAWSSNDGEKIVTCSDDNTFRLWRMFQQEGDKTQQQLESNKSLGICTRKKQFSTSTKTGCSDSSIRSKTCRLLDLNVKPNWTFPLIYSYKDCLSSPFPITPDLTNTVKVAESPCSITTPQRQSRSSSTSSSSSFTPKSNKSTKNNVTPSSITRRNKKPSTPKSSRLFMETWLKSPTTPPVSMKQTETKYLQNDCSLKKNTTNVFTFPTKVVVEEKTKHKLEIIPLKTKTSSGGSSKQISTQQCSKNNESKDDTSKPSERTLPNAKENNSRVKSAPKTNNRLITTPKASKGRKVSLRRKNTTTNTNNNGNIKTLLSTKRKRESDDNVNNVTSKRKRDNNDVPLSTDKENHTSNEINCKTNEPPQRVKDLLDFAEESSNIQL